MNTITLKYSGTEKSLDDWGLSMPNFRKRTFRQGPSLFSCVAEGADPAAAPIFPFNADVTIYANRSGSGTSWSGGAIIFRGVRQPPRGRAAAERSVSYVFEDIIGRLARLKYQQTWNLQAGAAPSARVFLFQKIGSSSTPWTYWKTNEQATDIINYAAACGLPIQVGTIDGIMPQSVYPMRAPNCLEALLVCFDCLPSAMSWIDYSTSPPSLNIRQRINLTPVTLPYDDGAGGIHETTDIISREDLTVSQVVLQYQQTNQISNVIWSSQGTDAYPIGSTGQAEFAVVECVDLRGAQRSYATGTITAAAFDPTTPAFWTGKDKSLADATISSLAVIDSAVKDSGDSAISLVTYPRELTNGQVAPWMVDGSNNAVKVIEATVTAHVSYTKKDANATTQARHKIENKAVTTRVKLTNSPAGDTTYQALASAAAAETTIANLAYQLWCDWNNVAVNLVAGVVTPPGTPPAITGAANKQWEGEHIIRESGDITTLTYSPGNVLNLDDSTTGATAWASMNAAIYEVEFDFFTGTTSIKFGPYKHESFEQFYARMSIFRVRLMFDDPNVRSTGQDTGGAGTQLGTDTRLEDTGGNAHADTSLHTVASVPASGLQTISQHDAPNNQWQLAQVNSSTGAVDNTNFADLICKLSHVNDTDAKLRLRTFPYKRASDCAAVYRWFLCSKEYAGSPPGGSDP